LDNGYWILDIGYWILDIGYCNMINHKVIEKTRVVNCPVDKVWWKWTTHEGLLTFFGLGNEVGLKLGGLYEICFLMDSRPGLKGGEGNKIISYVPEKMLSFTWNAPPQHPEIRKHKHSTWVVVHFKTLGGQTEVSLQHLGWLDGKLWDDVYDYFDSAWTKVLDWLEESCEKPS